MQSNVQTGEGWNPAPTDLVFINGLMYTQSRALSFRSESEESHIDSDCVVMRFFANQRFALNDRIMVCANGTSGRPSPTGLLFINKRAGVEPRPYGFLYAGRPGGRPLRGCCL